MPDAVSRKFAPFLLPSEVQETLGHHRRLRAREDLVRQGEVLKEAYFVQEGILCRYKQLSGGRRAVVGYLLPGDFCGSPGEVGEVSDHGIGSLTPVVVTQVPHHLLERLGGDSAMAGKIVAVLAIEAAVQRQWLANMGAPSSKRAAHLLCELRSRLAQSGLADEHGFALSLTQHDLSEALGISTVHVNRVLQHLKDLGLARIADRQVLIADLAKLEDFAEFDSAYLGTDAAWMPVQLAS
jgi:CRP-like cAMP-binding protein